MKLSTESLAGLQQSCRDELTNNILPFWLKHGLDREHGGILTGLDRDGRLLETDKSVWFQGRAGWTFSTAYAEIERKAEYLEAAKSCVDFIEKHCFDADGRMFFRVSREGKPVIKRKRYVFSETFAAIAMAAYGRASRDPRYAKKARELFERILKIDAAPGVLEPKFNPETRPARGFALPMILVATAQELRKALDPAADAADIAYFNAFIDGAVSQIETVFMKSDLRCVLEQTGPNGEFQSEHFEGRLVNPGHAIEAAWFILREADYRGGDERLTRIGATILDWMWELGWDKEHGGLLYYRDALGYPSPEYWHDMKFWWPHNEAIIACLYAYGLTGESRFAERFDQVYDWSFAHFPDKEHGEWYGYLHRDGSVSSSLKGNMFKGPFHVPRMFIVCHGLAGRMRAGRLGR